MHTFDAVILHGNFAAPLLTGRVSRPRLDDIDTAELKYVSNSETSFSVGGYAPHYPGMQIVELNSVDDGGGVWEHDLLVEGNLGGKQARRMRNGLRETDPLDGWDTKEDRWLTQNKNHFVRGSRDGSYVCIDVDRQIKGNTTDWWEVGAKYAGLKSPRARTRQVTCNGQVISSDQLRVELEQGWTNYQKGQASFPKLVITDSEYSLDPAPTSSVPSIRTPPGAPGVRQIIFNGADARRVWPPGWGYTCGYDQPFGLDVPLYINTHNYEWNMKYLPT